MNVGGRNQMNMKIGLVTVVAILIGGIAAVPAYGQAETETQIQKIPVEGVIINGGCPGAEDVEYSGTVRSIIHVTSDATGGFHLKQQLNVNLRGIGQTTGDDYHMTSNTGSEEFVSQDQSPVTATITSTAHIMDGIDQKGKLIIHLTINAKGETTVEKIELKIDCD